jgi:arylsulfatase A-like enzyme
VRLLSTASGLFLIAIGCGHGDDPPAPGPAPGSAAPGHAAPAASAAPSDAAGPAPTAPVDPAARDEHPVFDLGDNRLSAHRTVDGDLVVDAGSAGFARFTRFGLPAEHWRYHQLRDGARAALADRLASIDLLIDEPQRAAPLFLARVWASAPRTLTIKINGRKAAATGATATLEPGWQTIAIPVEADRWQVGENQIAFETGTPPRGKRGAPPPPPSSGPPGDDRLGFAWLRVAQAPIAADAPDPRTAASYDLTAAHYTLAAGAGLAWYAVVPDGAHVVAAISGGDACRVEVAAQTTDGTMAGGLLAGPHGRVDLSPLSGKVARIALTARDCPQAIVAQAQVTAPGPVPTVAAPGSPPRYVVLWMMDAFRAGSVRPFTPGARAEVPNFERLAKTGVIFRQFYVHGNESQTSHSSTFTSTYPAVHNVRLAGVGGSWKLPARLEVIGQFMKGAGLHTIGVTANGFVTADGGYARGFDEYRNLMRETGATNGIVYGEKVVADGLLKLGRAKDRNDPAFLFMGTVDTHGPWIARPPWLKRYDPGPYGGPFQQFGTAFDLGITSQSMGCAKIPPPRDLQRLRAIYDSAVSYQDARLGDFVAQLEKWGIYDQTMIVVMADHGEEMFEHGRCGHGGALTETLIRVPLLIHYPARFPGGVAVEEGAEAVDVLPTILDALDQPQPDQAQGQPLRPLSFGVGRGWVRPSYTSMYELSHALRLGTWKATVGRSGRAQVYDLAADPDERTSVAAERRYETRMLSDALGMFLGWRRVWKKAAWGVVTNMTARAAQELDAP